MHLAELWRYPVKSMAGERLERARLAEGGIEGDRVVYAVGPRGDIVSARTRPGLLRLDARLGEDGEPLVHGRQWESGEVGNAVAALAGPGVRLVRHVGFERFDILPLLLTTDGAVAALGEDGRRLRPNLLIGDVEGLAEREWGGRFLRVGGAVIGMRELRQRCVMTTFDPDTLVQDVEVLKRIHRDFAGRVGLNAWVAEPGEVCAGDEVTLLDAGYVPAHPPPAGGRYA